VVTALGRRCDAAIEEDDPRTAMRLAAQIVASPSEPGIVERIAALRHPLAIAKATTVWSQLAPAQQQALAWALIMSPHPSDDEARELLRLLEDPDGRIDALWRAVIEAPDDLDRRLVLADALLERGDPRGEAIAVQGNAYDHLGDTALIASDCSFHGGLLSSLSAGTVTTPAWAWDQPPSHRELCALNDVSPGYVTAERYANFLARLPRVPTWVRLERAHLDQLRKLGARVPFRNIEFSMWPPPHDLARELLAIAAYAPTLEGLAIRVLHSPRLEHCVEVARIVREKVKLRRFLIGLVPGHPEDPFETDVVSFVDAPAPGSAGW
jgi:uncharacterized protein (TIGR02996 family)